MTKAELKQSVEKALGLPSPDKPKLQAFVDGWIGELPEATYDEHALAMALRMARRDLRGLDR